MLTHQSTCLATAGDPLGFVDVTDQIQDIVTASEVTNGRVTVLRTEDGSTLIINEKESGLHHDVRTTIERLSAEEGAGTPPVGCASLVLPVVGGRIHLGTWQRILMLELEVPRDRSLLVQVVGE